MRDESLGRVEVPNRVLVVGDMGYLSDWSGAGRPSPPRLLPPDLVEKAERSSDWQIVGSDAPIAARRLDRQPLTYLYDIPDEAALVHHWEETFGSDQLDASLVKESERVPHRDRARRAAEAGGAGFQIHGVPFVALPTPSTGPFELVGRRSITTDDRWAHVELSLSVARATATNVVDHVGVDWARLFLADVETLSAWVHDDALDGQADVVFWGRDVAKAARKFRAPRLDEGLAEVHGWENLSIDDATRRAIAIDDWRERKTRGLRVDFRPHSHHYHVMRQVRASDTESGTVDIGPGSLLGFMTTWGDGFFDVELDSDESGRPVAVRIVFER